MARRRIRSHPRSLGTALVALIAAVVLLAPAPGAGARQPQRSYLALGDSLAFGYQQAKFEELFPNESPAAFDTGYVDDFGRFLLKTHRDESIVNDGCPGETTVSFIAGPCEYQHEGLPLHHPYVGGPSSSQLSDALAYLKANPGTVSPITLDIGANDALAVIHGCNMQAACVAEHSPALFALIAHNLGTILADLRGADPQAKIVVLGLYNPFGATIAGGDELTAALNEVMRNVASAAQARFADPLPVFNPPGAREAPTICLLTNMCPPPGKPTDIHPTDLGYAVLGDLILRQYLPGSPWRP